MNGRGPARRFRNFVFGVEDSLVSTIGLLSGIAVADVSKKTIILTGVVLIFVEAFSMAVGSLLSEHAAEEYATGAEAAIRTSIGGSIVMFFSYFISGFIPLAPYILIDPKAAFWISITLSLIALFILGLLSAKVSRTGVIRSGIEMLLLGGLAIAVGVLVGLWVNSLI